METKQETIGLWELMYRPSPKAKQQTYVLSPLFDLTVIALGIVGAISYFVSNHTG